MVKLASNSLDQMRSELKELQDEEDEEFRPTQYASNRAWELVSSAAAQISEDFPYGYAYGDGDGGIRIEWKSSPREVRLRVPSQKKGKEYIYHQSPESHKANEGASPDALVGWLRWLADK